MRVSIDAQTKTIRTLEWPGTFPVIMGGTIAGFPLMGLIYGLSTDLEVHWATWVVAAIGLVVGFRLATCFAGVVVDAGQRHYRRWGGILPSSTMEDSELSTAQTVVLQIKETFHHSRGTTIHFLSWPVFIEGRRGKDEGD